MTPDEMRRVAHQLRALSKEHERNLRMQGCLHLLEASSILNQLAAIVEQREARQPTHGTVKEEMAQNGYFACEVCEKMHMKWSGTACDNCNAPFPAAFTASSMGCR